MPDLRQQLFRYRSYTPIPFLLLMLAFAKPTVPTLVAGALVMLAGESLRFWGVAFAGSLTRVTGGVGAPQLIVAGPFAFVRNPLYLGNLLVYVGIGTASNALFPWLVLSALGFFFLQYRLIISLEEEFLEREFDTNYLEYRRSVPRFLPRLVPYRSDAQAHQRANWKEAVQSEQRTFQAISLLWIALLVIWSVGGTWFVE